MSFGKEFGFTPLTYIWALLGMSNASTYILVWKLQARMHIQLDRYTDLCKNYSFKVSFLCQIFYRPGPGLCRSVSFHPVAPVVISLCFRYLPQYLRKCTKIWDFEEVSVPILYFKSTTFMIGLCAHTHTQILSILNGISMDSSFIPPYVLVIVSV